MIDPRQAAGAFVPEAAAGPQAAGPEAAGRNAAHDYGEPAGYFAYPDERSLLKAFLEQVRAADPDILIGWNVINFDLRYLAGRCERAGMKLGLGVDGPV